MLLVTVAKPLPRQNSGDSRKGVVSFFGRSSSIQSWTSACVAVSRMMAE